MSHTYKYNISLNVAAAREKNHMEYFYGHVHNFYGHGVFIVHLHDVTAYWCFGWSPAAARARFFHDIVTEKTALSVRKFIETQ